MEYREILKEATRLKKEKRYDEACQTLRIAYQSSGVGEVILIQERLRLPMYLLLAGRRNEGWNELNRLANEFHAPYDQIPIRNQMRIFAEKEERWNDALFYSVWVYVMSLKNDIRFIKAVHYQADSDADEEPLKIENDDGSYFELDFCKINEGKEPFAYTAIGNPIFDVAHNQILSSLNARLDIDAIEDEFMKICQKINRLDLPHAISDKILEIIELEDETGSWVGDLHQFFRQQFME